MAECNEVTQIDINLLVDTVGSGGTQPTDILLGEAVEKWLFLPTGRTLCTAWAIHTKDILKTLCVNKVFVVS